MTRLIKYRKEIDGLRAVAVSSVVLFHAEFIYNGKKIFSGGFLGVDIFFVISGYLISLIILKGLKEKSFSFSGFYARRIRRIFPLLITVLLFSIPLFWSYFSPRAMLDFSESLLSSVFFYSNFHFYFEDSYWAMSSLYKPLLHTWSLAIEEQYYILAPIILILLSKYSRNKLIVVIVTLTVSSLLLSHYLSISNKDFAFFYVTNKVLGNKCRYFSCLH